MTCKVHKGIMFVNRFITAFDEVCGMELWASYVTVNPTNYGFYVSNKDNFANVVVEVFDNHYLLHYRVYNPAHGCPTLPLPKTFEDEDQIVYAVYNFLKENQPQQ